MLNWLGIVFRTQPADLDESLLKNEPADRYVWRLAGEKAHAAAGCLDFEGIVLAADTTVALDGHILGKPGSSDEAERMLKVLRGRTHQVYTAIGLIDRRGNVLVRDLCCTDVPMRNYSDDEIDAYVASGDPLDKAGAYAIQHNGFHPVEGFNGCFASVMGLPICHLKRTLKAMNFTLAVEPSQVCRDNLGYECPISEQVLDGIPGK